jgi:hypothetical protein
MTLFDPHGGTLDVIAVFAMAYAISAMISINVPSHYHWLIGLDEPAESGHIGQGSPPQQGEEDPWRSGGR